MSYTIDVLAVQPPLSYREALAVRDAVSDARDAGLGAGPVAVFEPPSAAMQELHRRLTARYPCITQDPDGPWSDGPLINNFGQHSATLGISYSRVDDVLPFVIGEATTMGFWVFDAQEEAVHLPGGGTLRPEHPPSAGISRRAWWQFWK
jgi:hypothetical protein